MDIILICRDALENSILGNIAVAMEAKKNGSDVGILFTQESLVALAGEGPFRWSTLLENRPVKMKVSKAAAAMGLQLASEKDKRWTDIFRLLKSAKEAGISLMACPAWTNFLQLEGKYPPEISSIDSQAMLKELSEAKTIMGGF